MNSIYYELRDIRKDLKDMGGDTEKLSERLFDVLIRIESASNDLGKLQYTLNRFMDDLDLDKTKIDEATILHLKAAPDYYSTMTYIMLDYIEKVSNELSLKKGELCNENRA